MKQYIERHQPDVRAVQWFKHGDVPGLAVDPDNPDNAILNPDARWTPQILKPGDYYIEHCMGDGFFFSHLPKDKFERTYREYVE